jgi:chromosomal replication initiation ATPase DnaA
MIRHIIEETCARWGVTEDDLYSPDRTRHVAWARAEAFARMIDESPLSYSAIGRIFDRDHSAVVKCSQAHRERIKKGTVQ